MGGARAIGVAGHLADWIGVDMVRAARGVGSLALPRQFVDDLLGQLLVAPAVVSQPARTVDP
jgi:hypothetical protein